MSSKLDSIIARGNRGHYYPPSVLARDKEANWIECADGFRVSVVAGGGMYCTPRPALCTCNIPGMGERHTPPAYGDEAPHDYLGPYTEVEVGFPSERPEPWDRWRQYAEDPEIPTKTVYGCVPVLMVQALVLSHGDER